MHQLSAFFVRNPVAANLLMVLILLAGVLSLKGIRIESFPRIPPRTITITVMYPGASTEQVDEGVTRKIEQALEGMPGIKRTYSVSTESMSQVIVEKNTGYDLQRLLNDARTRVDAIVGFPQLAERPMITRDEFSIFGLIVQVTGGDDEITLQQAARVVEEELLSHPRISNLEIFGKREYEVSIDVSSEKLESYGLTLQDVSQAISSNSFEYRSGVIESGGQRILLNTQNKAYFYEEFIRIPIMNLPDGRVLRLADIADVSDEFSEGFVAARYNGDPSVGIVINTDKNSNLLKVREAVDEVIAKVQPQLPDNITIDVWADASKYIKDRLELLRTNAWQGLIIILVLLALFLDLKLAFWVAVGIPISIAGSFALMGDWWLGHSLNDITTFGIIIVLGILVDDAIVVGESIHEARQRTKSPIQAAIEGVHKVSTPTIFGAMTTIAAFFPLLLIDNDIARIFAGFSVVVIVAVVVSLIESKLILPSHLASISLDNEGRKQKSHFLQVWERIRNRVDTGLQHFIHTYYRPALEMMLIHRYATLICLATVAVVGIGVLAKGKLETVFFPEVATNTVTVKIRMDQSSPEALAKLTAHKLETAAEIVNQELREKFDLDEKPIAKLMAVVSGREQVEAYGELTEKAMNQIGTAEIVNRWRDEVGEIEGADDVEFTGSFETGGGFQLQIVGTDLVKLREAVDAISASLRRVDGVDDVRSDLNGGQPEFQVKLKPEARHLGLTMFDLAAQIGNGFGGYEVQRMQRGDDEVRVYVRYKEGERKSLHELLTSRVVTPAGKWIPLQSVADLEPGYSPSAVTNRNGKRAVTIFANLDKRRIGAGEALGAIQDQIDEIGELWPGIEVKQAGELEEMGEVQDNLKRAMIFIAVLIYVLLAVPLRSYSKPFIIMLVVPFGFVGAALGHLIMGLPLSILSFFGMMAATGVVVNDSLVMVSRFNQLREEGSSLIDSLIQTGVSRFRPVFLTTTTTVCGLMPLLFETSEQAQYLIPAAASLAFAELFATPITLFIIPVALHVLHDASEKLRYHLKRFQPVLVKERANLPLANENWGPH